MKKGKIRSIVTEKVEEIADLCAHVGDNFDIEAIHKFRVAVKSLRSFLRLQKMHTGNSKINLTKKFKRLYDIAGTIRETQLEIDFFKTHEPELHHYTERLKQTLTLQQHAWEKHYAPKILDKQLDKLTGFKYKEMHPSQLSRFFSNRMEAISGIAHSSAPTDTEIHDARKKIKDLLYTSKVAEKKWKAAGKQVKFIPIEKLDHLSDMIGIYNDERIRLDHASTLPQDGMDKNEKSSLKHFKGRETKKLSKKKKDIFSTAQSFIKINSDNN